MAAELRDFRPEDAEGAARLLHEAAPVWLVTAEWLLHPLPERGRMRRWVAVEAGALLGYAEGNLRWSLADPGYGETWVAVVQRARRRGVGTRLHATAEAYVAALRVHTVTTEALDEGGVAFARRLGYRPTRTERHWTLDPVATALPPPEPPDGFRVVPLREVYDRREALHRVAVDAELDIPGDHERGVLDLEEWWQETMESPLLDLDTSAVVLEGETPVAFAWISRAGDRAENEMTGTLRSHRGRGLATLAKVATIRAASAAGVTQLATSNDLENAPMLRINERLGYRPTIVSTELEKRLARG